MYGWPEVLSNWPAELNGDVFPGYQIPVYRSGQQCEAMRWGLTHRSAKEFKQKITPSNARIETIDKKWPFKDAWNDNNRCLIPIAKYYEWPKIADRKVKHEVMDKDTDGMVVAGLWEPWNDALSCTMITRQADEYMSQLHHRMLCYLSHENAKSWLVGEMSKQELLDLEIPNIIFYPQNS